MIKITDEHLAKSWSQKSDGLKFFRRNSTTEADLAEQGWYVGIGDDGRYRLRPMPGEAPVDEDDDTVLIEPSALTAIPRIGDKIADRIIARRAGAPQAAATLDPGTGSIAPNMYRLEIVCSSTPDGEWPADLTTAWASSLAKRLKSDIRVRSITTGQIVHIGTHKKPKAGHATRPAKPKDPAKTQKVAAARALLDTPDGATAAELRDTLGWKAIAAEAYVSAIATRESAEMVMIPGTKRGEKRYRIVAKEG